MPVTRQNDIGLAGRKPASTIQAPIDGKPGRQQSAGSKSDPYLRQYVIEIPEQTAAQTYNTGFTMPANAVSAAGYLKSAGALVGTAPTISVGNASDAAALYAAANVVAGVNPTIQGAKLSAEEITYTIGGTVTTGQAMELVLTVLCSDS